MCDWRGLFCSRFVDAMRHRSSCSLDIRNIGTIYSGEHNGTKDPRLDRFNVANGGGAGVAFVARTFRCYGLMVTSGRVHVGHAGGGPFAVMVHPAFKESDTLGISGGHCANLGMRDSVADSALRLHAPRSLLVGTGASGAAGMRQSSFGLWDHSRLAQSPHGVTRIWLRLAILASLQHGNTFWLPAERHSVQRFFTGTTVF